MKLLVQDHLRQLLFHGVLKYTQTRSWVKTTHTPVILRGLMSSGCLRTVLGKGPLPTPSRTLLCDYVDLCFGKCQEKMGP